MPASRGGRRSTGPRPPRHHHESPTRNCRSGCQNKCPACSCGPRTPMADLSPRGGTARTHSASLVAPAEPVAREQVAVPLPPPPLSFQPPLVRAGAAATTDSFMNGRDPSRHTSLCEARVLPVSDAHLASHGDAHGRRVAVGLPWQLLPSKSENRMAMALPRVSLALPREEPTEIETRLYPR